jgi:hypothetical protein
MSKKIEDREGAIEAFKAGAKLHHKGILFSDDKMTLAGLVLSSDGVDYIDKHSATARDVLIPLLYHPDDDIRVTAASALIASHHDRALAVIHHIRDTCWTEAYGSASQILRFKKVFKNYVMGLCTPDPRYPIGHPADGAENDSTVSEGKS